MTPRFHQRTFLAVSIALSLLASLLPSHRNGAYAKGVATAIEIDRPVIFAGDVRPVYVLVRFQVPETPVGPSEERPPLNLALVLDRSGSMKEAGKLPYLKQAAKSILGRMTPRDRLAIVEYNEEVAVAWPSAPVESPALLAKVIDDLEARGATDLVAGMLAGVSQVAENYRESMVNRVLLLSDGLANRGVTHPLEILELVRQARGRGVPVTTLGLGLQYDEDLMQAIAENSGGAYYYIEDPAETASIFQRELTTLVATAVRDVDFRFIPGDSVRAVQVFGHVTRSDGGATVVELPDLYGGERRTLVMRLELEQDGEESIRLGEIRLAYENVADGDRSEERHELAVAVSSDSGRVDRAKNSDVIVEAALVEAEADHEASLSLLESGRWQEAKRRMAGLAARLSASNAELNDVRLAKKIEALAIEERAIVDAAAAPQSAAAQGYVKRSKQRLYEARKGQRGSYMLRLGDSGHLVERLQQAMKESGFYTGSVDGTYTAELEKAVRSYQSKQQLASDGIAGPATLRALGLY